MDPFLCTSRSPRPRCPLSRPTRARSRLAFVAACLAVAVGSTIASTAPAVAQQPDPIAGPYRPPVDAPIIDPFRPPLRPFGPGNRGLSYAVAPLTPIRAAGDGEVVFAGQVGGALHVTIAHPDSLRTSYSYLAATSVGAGAVVAAGSTIGWSSEVFHFGVRAPDGTYLDPELLWSGAWVPRLVPGGDDGTGGRPEPAVLLELARERSGPLSSWLVTGGTTLQAATVASRRDFDRRLDLWRHYAGELLPGVHVQRMVDAVEGWRDQLHDCTPAGVAAVVPTGRRIVVEVGGIGSTSDAAAIADLDVVGLGYEPGDVLRFSYEGGRVPPSAGADHDPFSGLTTTEYGAAASQGDLDESGRRLARMLDEVARAAPGVPIDIIAHSQGGLVARLALGHADAAGILPDEVEHLVTLGSPHQGADLATAIEATRTDPGSAAILDRARTGLGVELDPASPAAGQLSEVSPVVLGLADRPVPAGISFRSIAARGDLVVTAGRTRAPGAVHRTVSLSGISAHDRLPSSPEATREVALALGDRPPTCTSLHDTLVDVAVGDSIAMLQDTAGLAALGLGAGVPDRP